MMTGNHQLPNIGACGDNCDECPRFSATRSGSRDELACVARLWFDLGLRDRVVTPDEISCKGCLPENRCAYTVQRNCAFQKGYRNCGYCREYPCAIVADTFRITEETHRRAADISGFESIYRAFFMKKENLDGISLRVWEEDLAANHGIRIVQMDFSRINEIRNLWEALNSHHLKNSTYFTDHFSRFTFETRVESLSKKDKLVFFVALRDEEKLGYAVVSINEGVGEVDSLFVIEAYRSMKLGHVLFLKALDWLAGSDCSRIHVAIAEGNEIAMAFYERYGFRKRMTVMEKQRVFSNR
jgi:diamine N-acetyltransferase